MDHLREVLKILAPQQPKGDISLEDRAGKFLRLARLGQRHPTFRPESAKFNRELQLAAYPGGNPGGKFQSSKYHQWERLIRRRHIGRARFSGSPKSDAFPMNHATANPAISQPISTSKGAIANSVFFVRPLKAQRSATAKRCTLIRKWRAELGNCLKYNDLHIIF